jgi:putative redox protein
MAHATAILEQVHYRTAIEAGGHRIVADEPPANGGADAGPSPYDLLLASLSACTAITLRMYADRKQWPMTKVTVDLHFTRDADKNERIDRVLHLEGDLTEEQRARFADIAERTPVTLTLKRGLPILTTLAPAGP